MSRKRKRGSARRTATASPLPKPVDADSAIAVLGVLVGLAVVVGFVYSEVAGHAFLTFDDDRYVAQNQMVQSGLSWEGTRWAFTTTSVSNWHPLTWLSHMLDCEIFGVVPGPHHLVNVAWHVAVCGLVFLTWRRLTGALWPSALVAGLLAVHPIHVESVAWLAERKDLLCGFFWWLAVYFYVGYGRAPSPGRYALVVLAFVASLLAKPMAVTLPAALLLLDAWPLRRLEEASAQSRRRVVLEKLPLLALSIASAAITIYAQRAGGALADLRLPVGERIENALLSYVSYLRDAVWPTALAPLYPLGETSTAAAGIAGVALIGVTVAAWQLRRTQPHLLFGWLWFLGTLLPVIGLVQVGSQARADRYMYIPLVGLYVATAWTLAYAVVRARIPRTAVAGAAALVLLLLAGRTHAQVRIWSDTVTLFEHSLARSGPNAVAHGLLGREWAVRRDWPRAERHYREAVRLRPTLSQARNNLGTVLIRQGNYVEAIEQLRSALDTNPGNYRSLTNLGYAYLRQGRLVEAEAALRASLEISPGTSETHSILADVLERSGRTVDAQEHRTISRRLAPDASRVRPPSERSSP